MLGFSPVLLQAFCTMLGYSQHDIMYIILQHIFMFISQEIRLGACCWHVLPSGSGAGHQKLFDVASMACLARRLGGWTMVPQTVGNRSGLTGYRSNRSGPVPVWSGINRSKFKIWIWIQKKWKILKKFLKILQDATNLMVSNFLKNSFI